MSWNYTVTKGRRLRRGYTTGSCAAAAAKAAAAMLFGAEELHRVSILTPGGIELQLPVSNIERGAGQVSCSVQKDSGDDPDITGGIHVFACAAKRSGPGIVITAGEGVGVVTRPGLPVPVGEPAINPVPLEMIRREVSAAVPPGSGVQVTISIPGGEQLARNTFNPRLGIVGGLSILGTTGIVEPMSEEAYREALALELKVAAAEQPRFLVLVPGNHGKKVAREQLSQPAERIVKMSNFVGFALDRCIEQGVRELLLVGHAGKLFKVAAGIFNTHSKVADARFEVFAAHAALLGAGPAMVKKLQRCASTEEMFDLLDGLGKEGIYDLFASRVSRRAEDYSGGRLSVGTVLFSLKRGILGMDGRARQLLEEYR